MLPQGMLAKGLALAEEMYYCGQRVTDMTREELIAVVALEADRNRSQREEHARQLNVLRDFR